MPSNCYGYALGIDRVLAPGTNDDRDSDINDWDQLHGITNQRVIDLMDACKRDGLEEIPVSNQKIAVFINEYAACLDYHFYRLGPSGWSHKLGQNGQPTSVQDPRVANKKLVGKPDPNGDYIIAQHFCGYLYVPKVFVWTLNDDPLFS